MLPIELLRKLSKVIVNHKERLGENQKLSSDLSLPLAFRRALADVLPQKLSPEEIRIFKHNMHQIGQALSKVAKDLEKQTPKAISKSDWDTSACSWDLLEKPTRQKATPLQRIDPQHSSLINNLIYHVIEVLKHRLITINGEALSADNIKLIKPNMFENLIDICFMPHVTQASSIYQGNVCIIDKTDKTELEIASRSLNKDQELKNFFSARSHIVLDYPCLGYLTLMTPGDRMTMNSLIFCITEVDQQKEKNTSTKKKNSNPEDELHTRLTRSKKILDDLDKIICDATRISLPIKNNWDEMTRTMVQ